ncbi:hypothetical protein PsorP6_015116 [Peronosclerospora sorghi]|uniref:Uncharacterized protein n=1 Tax=Peronosclerospora sorghi TaxID=230839 RepID=A0ACC0VTK7_9STRA|nr:hypothetical protein PsorP6_015116 [Peronosclerospora sorghi]
MPRNQQTTSFGLMLQSVSRNLAAMVCGEMWRLRTFKTQDAAATVKKMRLKLGTFDYRRAKLQDADIKSARKALVTFIHHLLPVADNFKERSAKLKQFGERTLREFEVQASKSLSHCDSDSESEEMHVNDLFEESGDESSESQDEEELAEDETMEEPVGNNNLETMKPNAEAEDEDQDLFEADAEHMPKLEMKMGVNRKMKIKLGSELRCLKSRTDSSRTRPYILTLIHCQFGTHTTSTRWNYLIARMNNIDPRNVHVHVQWNEYSGVLRISGFRLPTCTAE